MNADEDIGLEFRDFGKIARFNRECVVTEKIDGMNGQILIRREDDLSLLLITTDDWSKRIVASDRAGNGFVILAGSRSRWLTKGNDNHGFFAWVESHATELLGLGVGRHFGEWWGSGIRRGYGLKAGEKRFSLFNVSRWGVSGVDGLLRPDCCDVVPVLYRGPFSSAVVDRQVFFLEMRGSRAAPGYVNPEGVVVFHTHANQLFKVTIEDDAVSKTEAIAQKIKLDGPVVVVEPVSSAQVIDMVDALIAAHPDKVEQARSNTKLLGWFVGNIMKQTKGAANAQAVLAVLDAKIGIAA